MQTVGQINNFFFILDDLLFGARGIFKINHLYLADHDRIRAFHAEAACLPDDFRRRTHRGNNGRLLHGHGYHIIFAVNQKIQAYAERQAENADHIFNHFIRLLGVQEAAAFIQKIIILVVQKSLLLQDAQALLYSVFIKPGQP